MTPTNFAILLGVALATAAPLSAQLNEITTTRKPLQPPGTVCEGPGAALGVIAYHCASCGVRREKSGFRRTFYSFNAEPVILETTAGSVLRSGDVIEAVGGKPITTSEGANAFVNPFEHAARPFGREPLILIDGVLEQGRLREIVVRVRRDGRSISLTAPVAEQCDDDSRPVTPAPDTSSGTPPGPLTNDGMTGRLGLAVSCDPTCTRARARDGTEYWKFDDNPAIVALRPGGPSELAGLRVGDRVTDVDGISIVTEDGALHFLRAESKDNTHLTVLRGGRKVGYLVSQRARARKSGVE